MLSGLSLAEIKPVWNAVRRALPWALRHPFVLRPVGWLLALVVTLAAGAGLSVSGVPMPYSLVVLIGVFVTICAALVGWRRLARPGEHPVVLLAPFEATTDTGREAATLHRAALARRLTEGRLDNHFEVRTLPVPVTLADAKLILEETSARGVVFGTVRAIGDSASWEAELLFRWGDEEGFGVHLEGDEVTETFNRREAPAPSHEAVSDFQAPVARLVAERYEADHASRLQGTLLVLAAVEMSHHDDDETRRLLDEAEAYRAQLSVDTRGAYVVARMGVTDFESGTAMLDWLEAQGRDDADAIALWNLLVPLTYVALQAGDATEDDLYRRARFAAECDPNDSTARYNLGQAHMGSGESEEALEVFRSLRDDEDYGDRAYLHFETGMVAYNLGQHDDAIRAYSRAVELNPTGQGHLFLADAYRAVGNEQLARKHYIEALSLEPDLVEAYHGLMYGIANAGQRVPRTRTFTAFHDAAVFLPQPALRRHALWWLLRFYRRRHPEDFQTISMLGYVALQVEDFEEAKERLTFWRDLLYPEEYESLGWLVTAHWFLGDREQAERDLDVLWEGNEVDGSPPTDVVRRRRAASFVTPFIARPGLRKRPEGEALLSSFFERFGGVTGDREELLRRVKRGQEELPVTPPAT